MCEDCGLFNKGTLTMNDNHQIALTLAEKESTLLATVALPTAQDWQLVGELHIHEEVLASANRILAEVLEGCKASKYLVWGQIAEAIYKPLAKLEQEYNVGLVDSEGCQTVARFFGVNYTPAIYEFLRYPSIDFSNP